MGRHGPAVLRTALLSFAMFSFGYYLAYVRHSGTPGAALRSVVTTEVQTPVGPANITSQTSSTLSQQRKANEEIIKKFAANKTETLKTEGPKTTPNKPSKINFIDLDIEVPDIDALYEKLVIVTAFSQNHFQEAKGIIATAQKKMPNKRIVVYDLGMNEATRKEVNNYCNVEVKDFPFEDYPEHVKSLLVYSWKPLILNLTLNEFGAVFWGDAGIRFRESLKMLLPNAVRHHGYMSLIHSYEPKKKSNPDHQYHHTMQEMFVKLGVNRTEYFNSKGAPHLAANRQLYINSTTIQKKLLQPMVACALELECIAPTGSKVTRHRFDASALSLLAYKNLYGEWDRTNDGDAVIRKVLDIERFSGAKYELKTCGGKNVS